MVTRESTYREEVETTSKEPADITANDQDGINTVSDEKATWYYTMPFPGVRYYSFARPSPVRTPDKANAGN